MSGGDGDHVVDGGRIGVDAALSTMRLRLAVRRRCGLAVGEAFEGTGRSDGESVGTSGGNGNENDSIDGSGGAGEKPGSR
jgi:hypothetical protein